MAEPDTEDGRVVFRVLRFDPEGRRTPETRDYPVPSPPGMVVLEGLWWIKEHRDATLAWRSSCRMGLCGSCGMLINGRPMLACNTQVREAARHGFLHLAPLPNHDVVRDLVPDLDPMFEAHRRLSPWIRGNGTGDAAATADATVPDAQYRQKPAELLEYLQFSYCIKCGCCLSACPTVATDPTYSGPQALSQAYRYLADNRDRGFAERAAELATEAGPWRCHYAGECSRVCPKGVDPARAVQLLKRELVRAGLGLGRRRPPAEKIPPEETRPRQQDVPEPPPPTVAVGARSPSPSR